MVVVEAITIESTQKRLAELLAELVKRPDVPPQMAADLHQVFYALRDHVYHLGYQKRLLDELGAELDPI